MGGFSAGFLASVRNPVVTERALEVALAAYGSAKTGQPVRIEESG